MLKTMKKTRFARNSFICFYTFIFFAFSSANAQITLLSDDFEDGNTDGWTTSGSIAISTSNPYVSSFGVRSTRRGYSSISRTLDVSAVDSVDVSVWMSSVNLDSDEEVYSRVSTDGSNWTLCYSGRPTSYIQVSCNAYDVSGENSLYIQIGGNANRSNEYGYYDYVQVIGYGDGGSGGNGGSITNCDAIYDWPGHGDYWYEWTPNGVSPQWRNPTQTDPRDDTADWNFSSPEAQGMLSGTLDAGLNWASSNNRILNITIIRNNNMVRERFYNGSELGDSNNIHSGSKSLMVTYLAAAVDQGYITSLDDLVKDYLPNYSFSGNENLLTIRDLMQMRSDYVWEEGVDEENIETQPDWTGALTNRSMPNTPGTTFNYSSADTQLLSAVIQSATGKSTCEFAHINIFEPNNVFAERWGRDPQGVYSGGYNVYMTPREYAKIGKYILDIYNNGASNTFNDIIKDSFNVTTPDSWIGYGELWWTRTISGHDMVVAWGYGGQLLYIIPDLNVVMVATHDTSVFPTNEFDHEAFVRDYLIPSIENF